ncbi:tyrosine-type recombinase/integrase [Herminiimonas contaminans]|uniref:Tyrosine-type recombinase/integrase n=1 Tax=Herminiimonas contaminans TaxID=1111140 RepID=A0ABS0EPZ1_9BURK|nr:tyrosine-type recombinase/integrase [Herminiimonas contaminans]MBF8176940.1 tyrosine-type recombinase/integrase [Herminiimonas contaminans]
MLHHYLPPDEQKQLIDAAGTSAALLDRRDHAWMRALLYSGLRIQEFALIKLGTALTALRGKYLFIPREDRKGKFRDHKVFVTEQLRSSLTDLVTIHFEMVGDSKSNLDHALIISRQSGQSGQPMSVRSYQLRIKYWAKVAGLTSDVSPHWLRHTRAMNIMRNSQAKDPRGVTQQALGHVSISSTGIYTGVLREELESALTQTDTVPSKRVSLKQLRADFERSAS